MKQIKALLTLYYPEETVRQKVHAIAQQADVVYLCDNTPNADNRQLFTQEQNVVYVPNGRNLGLSGAFNKVLKNADFGWQNSDYIIFFDQDSSIKPQHISSLVSEYEQLLFHGCSVGCLGPVYFDNSNGKLEVSKIKNPLCAGHCYSVASIITSSMLTTYENLQNIGFWNESVFLDLADWDMCWRFTSSGKLCCLTSAVILNHTVGFDRKRIGSFTIRRGTPIREYYQTRDCMKLFLKWYTPLRYKILFLIMLTLRPIEHALFLDKPAQRIRYVMRGIRDFFRGKNGEFAND